MDSQDIAGGDAVSGQVIKVPRNAGKYARERRKELGMTQRELAERAGVSERTIYSFELGEKPGMHLNKLLAVYGALDLSLVAERADPVGAPGQGNPSQERVIADFLAQMGGGSHGRD